MCFGGTRQEGVDQRSMVEIPGRLLEALQDAPKVDAVFVGGGWGAYSGWSAGREEYV